MKKTVENLVKELKAYRFEWWTAGRINLIARRELDGLIQRYETTQEGE